MASAESKDPYLRYAYFRRQAYLNIQEKYKIMASELLQYIPDMKPKDPRRFFDDNQRLAIYSKAKGKCEECEKRTRFEDGADHRIRHADGGADNGK
jgi:hypothetical protein